MTDDAGIAGSGEGVELPAVPPGTPISFNEWAIDPLLIAMIPAAVLLFVWWAGTPRHHLEWTGYETGFALFFGVMAIVLLVLGYRAYRDLSKRSTATLHVATGVCVGVGGLVVAAFSILFGLLFVALGAYWLVRNTALGAKAKLAKRSDTWIRRSLIVGLVLALVAAVASPFVYAIENPFLIGLDALVAVCGSCLVGIALALRQRRAALSADVVDESE